MSGTSLDGLDVVLCELNYIDNQWSYEFVDCSTIVYDSEMKNALKSAPILMVKELLELHRHYGKWLGEQVNDFMKGRGEEPIFIASHGHTVFHEPDVHLNFQLGDGNMIAAVTGISTVSDFRSMDVCLNGQGAPLVPVGDKLLFSDYDACVNIGGFANVSCELNGQRIAWDICPVNFVINRLISALGLSMDEGGQIGQKGMLIPELLDELDSIAYYQKAAPKSLAQEWVEDCFWPIIDRYRNFDLSDVLRTCYEHMSTAIANDINEKVSVGKVLFTGGGVYNSFLMRLIRAKLKAELVIPDKQLVEYKEALVFALLGALRYRGEINCLKSVTGADRDCSSGIINFIQN